jgi:hypothetical protein
MAQSMAVSATNSAGVSRIALRTARRCALIVSFHSFGATPVHYGTTMSGRLWLTGIWSADTLASSH